MVKGEPTAAAKSSEVYLATDLDREGEAIAWHLYEVLGLTPEQTRRVVFHEITKPAIDEAFAHPRTINMDLVDAQQARRVLDRLAGYNPSPLLWRKVRSRLSAGRVQSVALHLIVEREREIESFVPEEYWTLDAELTPSRPVSSHARGKSDSVKAENGLLRSLHVWFECARMRRSSRRVTSPPFWKDLEHAFTLSRRDARRAHSLPICPIHDERAAAGGVKPPALCRAQDDGCGPTALRGDRPGRRQHRGLITYMRTDSTNVAEQAQAEAREYVTRRYGPGSCQLRPRSTRHGRSRLREAHEAIRPAAFTARPPISSAT